MAQWSHAVRGLRDAGARRFLWLLPLLLAALPAPAGDLDTIGAILLRQVDSSLTGAGVKVAQAEAGAPAWEVNPAAVGQPPGLFTYGSTDGSTNVFPNSLGSESGHADAVGNVFYGLSAGLSPGVAHVDNYEANYFYSALVRPSSSLQAKVVNQSFIFISGTTNGQMAIDSAYDTCAATRNVLFVSGAGNGGAVQSPATAYNGLAVGAYGGGSSVGPTLENGRSKPDLTAPASVTSYSTPLVAGAAALLAQAAARGDGGAGTTSLAADIRTLKCLLLNGAVKPADWSAPPPAPLDPRYGAGLLNVFNAWHQLAAGRCPRIEATQVNLDDPHPAGAAAANVPALTGWDFNAVSSTLSRDGVNHYYLAASNAAGAAFHLTATLVWNRLANQTAINDLNLFLVNTLDNSVVAASTSRVDNVEHLLAPRLPPGRYDLQVLKRGGGVTNRLTTSESYALAFECFVPALALSLARTQVLVSWPIAPDGFALESAPSLSPPVTWSPVPTPPLGTNQQHQVPLSAPLPQQFFRLRRP